MGEVVDARRENRAETVGQHVFLRIPDIALRSQKFGPGGRAGGSGIEPFDNLEDSRHRENERDGEPEAEAAVGGPIGLVHDGDIIEIDIRERRIDLLLSKAELKRRRTFFAPKQKPLTGILARYAKTVSQADKGAVLERD